MSAFCHHNTWKNNFFNDVGGATYTSEPSQNDFGSSPYGVLAIPLRPLDLI
jgi:hypothetical protein